VVVLRCGMAKRRPIEPTAEFKQVLAETAATIPDEATNPPPLSGAERESLRKRAKMHSQRVQIAATPESVAALQQAIRERQVVRKSLPKSRGRGPTLYCPEIGEAVCRLVAQGLSIPQISTIRTAPHYTSLYEWMRDFPEFHEKMLLAWEIGAHALSERAQAEAYNGDGDLVEQPDREGGTKMVPNNANVKRSELVVDTLFRLAAARNRRVYGKQDVAVNVNVNANLGDALDEALRRVRAAREDEKGKLLIDGAPIAIEDGTS
jgi:hypothetical protein